MAPNATGKARPGAYQIFLEDLLTRAKQLGARGDAALAEPDHHVWILTKAGLLQNLYSGQHRGKVATARAPHV